MAKEKEKTFDLEEFAKVLVDFWKDNPDAKVKKIWAKRNVSVGDVVNGLLKLVASGDLNLGILGDLSTTAKKIEYAIGIIKVFQKLAQENPDGVLGRFTRGKLNAFRGCNDSRKSDVPVKAGSRADGAADLGLLFFFIEESLLSFSINGVKARQMIDEGIVAWTSRIDLVMKLVRVPDEANIIMRWHNFDGPGGTLADAHVGGRNVNQRLELRFDETESWTESKFITTARHELGHIIGLTHSGALPGDLMNPFLNEGIVDPSDNDIARAAKIWD